MDWSLIEHGDAEVEKTWWPRLGPLFPNYEVFWRSYVVPQTFRMIDPANVMLRPDSPPILRDLANANFGTFQYIAHATEALDNLVDQVNVPTLSTFFNMLYAARRCVARFFAASRKVAGEYGGPQINAEEARFRTLGLSGAWDSYDEAARLVDAYHGALTHEPVLIRVGDLIPAGKWVREFSDVAQLPRLTESILRQKFSPASAVAGGLHSSFLANLNDLWSGILREMAQLPRLQELITDLRSPSQGDHTLGRELAGAQLSAWAPQSGSSLTVRPSEIGGIQYDRLKR